MFLCLQYFFLSLDTLSTLLPIVSMGNFTALSFSFVFVSHLFVPETQD